MQIHFSLPDRAFTVTLSGGTAASDFASRLPLTLSMRDFHGIEKIADLPERLSTAGEAEGMDPDVGDLTYYAPWGNIAFFYRDFGYADGLVPLGRLDGDAAVLASIQDGSAVVVTRLS